jgi:hypothetical protein
MGITQETLLMIVRTGGIGTLLGLLFAVLNYTTNYHIDARGRGKVELRGINLLMMAILLGGGLLLMAFSVGAAVSFRGTDTLPVTGARVLSIFAYTRDSRNPDTGVVESIEALDVEYEYAVNGVSYRTTTETMLDAKTRFWEVGDTIPIFYYPMFPNSPMFSSVDNQVIYLTAGFGIDFWITVFISIYGAHAINWLNSRFRG